MNEKLKKLSDLSNVKVGDTLWHFMLGDVVVKKVYTLDANDTKPHVMTIQKDGKEYTVILEWLKNEELFPVLFLKNPFTEESSLKERWMMVSQDGKDWVKRRVFAAKIGRYLAWNNAEDDTAADKALHTSVWKYAKELPQTIELTKEEIAERLGIDTELLIIKEQ